MMFHQVDVVKVQDVSVPPPNHGSLLAEREGVLSYPSRDTIAVMDDLLLLGMMSSGLRVCSWVPSKHTTFGKRRCDMFIKILALIHVSAPRQPRVMDGAKKKRKCSVLPFMLRGYITSLTAYV